MVSASDNHRRNGRRERRQYDRFATRLPVRTRRDHLTRAGRADRAAECRLQVTDFSLGGLRAESPIPLKVDEPLTLRLPATPGHPAIRLTGQVVRCRRRADRFEVGIALCQTRPGLGPSPLAYLPRLFSQATEMLGEVRPISAARS